MTDDEIKKAWSLCEAATPGPWSTSILDEAIAPECMSVAAAFGGQRIYARAGSGYPLADARFIAAARTGWPEALAEIERLRAERDELRQRMAALEAEREAEAELRFGPRPDRSPGFEAAWGKLSYQYGPDELENVRLGWDMAWEQINAERGVTV